MSMLIFGCCTSLIVFVFLFYCVFVVLILIFFGFFLCVWLGVFHIGNSYLVVFVNIVYISLMLGCVVLLVCVFGS